ncbi:MAG: nucleotidyltransferase domain-containing protein [Kiritimatiellaeota bacterium]|nr:nucleotidyltransferase domain-containing protein [Kiritimatiellota bacterium]
MSEMMKTKIQDALDGMVRRIVERFHPEKIILFGSCARGELSDDSDIDILIVMPVEGSRRKKANEIDIALADRTVPVDLLVLTPEQFDQQKEMIGTVVREAVREGRVIHEGAA